MAHNLGATRVVINLSKMRALSFVHFTRKGCRFDVFIRELAGHALPLLIYSEVIPVLWCCAADDVARNSLLVIRVILFVRHVQVPTLLRNHATSMGWILWCSACRIFCAKLLMSATDEWNRPPIWLLLCASVSSGLALNFMSTKMCGTERCLVNRKAFL